MIASKRSIMAALEKYYFSSAAVLRLGQGGAHKSFPPGFESAINTPAVIRLLDLMLNTALKANSTELQFEVCKEKVRVRYCVEGHFYEMEPPPVSTAGAVMLRLKLLVQAERVEGGTSFLEDWLSDLMETTVRARLKAELSPEGEVVTLSFSYPDRSA